MLKPMQVDLSMLFLEPTVAEGQPTNHVPVFLSGERRQAVYTSTLIGPVKTVDKLKKEVNRVQLQDYLYVTSHLSSPMKLTPLRSKYSIELDQDLDDSAVSLLVENGLKRRFPDAYHAWEIRNTESKKTAQKSVFENKLNVDKHLRDDQPLLEDALTREITRRILDSYPYVLLFEFYLSKQDFDVVTVHLT